MKLRQKHPTQQGEQRRRRQEFDNFAPLEGLTVPPLRELCACAVPVRCFTDGEGRVMQECLRCGESNIVERRAGIPTVTKKRAVEFKMFGPVERS